MIFGDLTQAAATLGAAFVSACIALLVVIVAKDQKVSEFRQAWIDKLRDDIAEAISAASAITVIVVKPEGKLSDVMFAQWSRLAAALARVELRLNTGEETHQALIGCIRDTESLLHRMDRDPADYDQSEWLALQGRVIEISQRLLKIEWDRVRSGEPMYRTTKGILFAVLATVPLTLLVGYACANAGAESRPSAVKAAVIGKANAEKKSH